MAARSKKRRPAARRRPAPDKSATTSRARVRASARRPGTARKQPPPSSPPAVEAERQAPRPTTEAQQAAFLGAYASVGVVTAACKLVGVDRQRHYEWLADQEKYPDYEKRFKDAHEQACDRLEAEAVRRAVQGWDEPVYQMGALVGTKRMYSDRMLELMLKARRPGTFRDRQSVEHTGKDGGPIETKNVTPIDLTKLTDEELDMLERIVGLPKTAAPADAGR